MSDLISRQDAIDEAYEIIIDGQKLKVVQVETLMGLPSAERSRGEWIEGETFYFCGEQRLPMKCSVCGRTALNEPWCYCPNCGAKMKGADDE